MDKYKHKKREVKLVQDEIVLLNGTAQEAEMKLMAKVGRVPSGCEGIKGGVRGY